MFSFFTKTDEKVAAAQRAHAAWVKRHHKEVVEPCRLKIQVALDQISRHMFDDLWAFKILLQRAAFHFQWINRDKFFKATGRKRAKLFSSQLDKSSTCADILTALQQTLAHGNYDHDSFKTILHQKILESYPAHQEVLKLEALNDSWIVLDKFFRMLCVRLRMMDNHVPGLIL